MAEEWETNEEKKKFGEPTCELSGDCTPPIGIEGQDRLIKVKKNEEIDTTMAVSLTISNSKRDNFIEELLKTFTENQDIILKVSDNEIKARLTFYSSTSRSGEGLKHGYEPLDMYISLRNLATLLGVDKNNLLAKDNQFHVLYKIEESILNYKKLTSGAVDDAFNAFYDYIKEIKLNYYIYRAFRERSSKDFSMTKLCKLLKIEGESLLFRDEEEVQYDTIFSRLVNIFLLQNDIQNIGNILKSLKSECYDICLNYLFDSRRIESEVSKDTFDIFLHSLLVLNNKMNPPSKQVSLSDLSSKISPAENLSAQRSYLYGVLYRGSRMRVGHLNNLLRLMRDGTYIKSPHNVIKKVRGYLYKYYWKKFKVKANGYHKYWDRDELKFSLRKFLFDETLGLDVNVFNFIRLDLGDAVELHHIFENIESIFLKDLAPLLTSSHKSLTFSFKTEQEWNISCNIIYQRRKLLSKFSLLNYTKENEKKIKYNFYNNKLWEGMSKMIIEQWIERWKDRKRMNEEDWYKKYKLSAFYYKYINLIASLRDTKSKFSLWYFEYFIPNYL
jgi:hypothetical protein